MTLAALADELGLTYQQVHKYESGRNRISASTLFKAAETLGVELSFFFAFCGPAERGDTLASPPMTGADDDLTAALLRIEDPDVREKLLRLLEAITKSDRLRSSS
ncbi:helix-turn-helix domain-containing protein [Aureimonas phyllosphaerae]